MIITNEDRNAILEVIAKYSYTYDSLDAEGFADLFIEDACWEYYFSGKNEPKIRLTSRKDIREWAAQRHQERKGKFTSRHHQSSTVFESYQKDLLVTKTMVLITHHEFGEPHPIPTTSGEYHDLWQKTTAGWKIAQRVLYSDRSDIT
jgi:hypothetical protein